MTTTPTTTTPTSGAADLRATFSEMLVDLPNTEPFTLFKAGFDAALAAGQAIAAPAEPDPTPGDHPQPCDSELFESGVSVGLFDIPKWTAEALCKGIAAATGARVDWHYIGGRVHVKALPAPTSAEGVAYAALPEPYCNAHDDADACYPDMFSEHQMRAFADATCALRASRGQAPVLWLSPEQFANFVDADEAQFGRYVPARKTCVGNFTMPLFAAPAQPAAQAGEYPALVCDYCGALTPDPWHSSGMLHGKMSKHIHSCDACAARGAAKAQVAVAGESLVEWAMRATPEECNTANWGVVHRGLLRARKELETTGVVHSWIGPYIDIARQESMGVAEHYRNAIARARLLDSDLSNLTERGAKVWAGVDAQGLRDGGASPSANAGEPSAHIKEPYTLAEIKAKIASNDYSAEMLLQHAMLLLDSVQEDAALWRWLAEYLVGTRTDLDDEIVACETVNDLRKLVESAIKQGEKQ